MIDGNEQHIMPAKVRLLKKDRDCAMWCAKRMASYGVVWGTCGTIATEDPDGLLKEMTENHLKSLVRRDYIETHGSYPGLSRIIEDIVAYAKGFAAHEPANVKLQTLHGKLKT